ncbi:hypothetical protein AWW70_20320 [Bacillus mycoides]|uniref:Uncharacterized protein n=2 Tax=Bacillus mycoides TaxID=1405 RepID=A0A120EE92_BACMY|nr:hypothetical protein AWW70_20320 [Bacillus mycoides]
MQRIFFHRQLLVFLNCAQFNFVKPIYRKRNTMSNALHRESEYYILEQSYIFSFMMKEDRKDDVIINME